jgi:DNA-binding transcriptional ArsR family regulator
MAVVDEALSRRVDSAHPSPTADEALADFFQVLASPIRLAVVRLLLKGERCVGELIDELGIAQPRLSNHLACLRNCGLVRTRRDGNYIYYALADPRLADVIRSAEDLADMNAERLVGCEVLSGER